MPTILTCYTSILYRVTLFHPLETNFVSFSTAQASIISSSKLSDCSCDHVSNWYLESTWTKDNECIGAWTSRARKVIVYPGTTFSSLCPSPSKIFKDFLWNWVGRPTGGIIWEVEGRGSGSKGVAYHTDSPTQVEIEDFDLGW